MLVVVESEVSLVFVVDEITASVGIVWFVVVAAWTEVEFVVAPSRTDAVVFMCMCSWSPCTTLGVLFAAASVTFRCRCSR